MRMNKVKETRSKAGDPALNVSYQVIKKVGTEDEGKNRLIFDFLLLEHKNPICREITDKSLNSYLKAIGKSGGLEDIDNDFSRLDDFLDSPFIAVVGIKEEDKINPKTGQPYEPKNIIKAYKAR